MLPHHECGEQHGYSPSGLHSAFEPSDRGYCVPQRLSLLHFFEPEIRYIKEVEHFELSILFRIIPPALGLTSYEHSPHGLVLIWNKSLVYDLSFIGPNAFGIMLIVITVSDSGSETAY